MAEGFEEQASYAMGQCTKSQHQPWATGGGDGMGSLQAAMSKVVPIPPAPGSEAAQQNHGNLNHHFQRCFDGVAGECKLCVKSTSNFFFRTKHLSTAYHIHSL